MPLDYTFVQGMINFGRTLAGDIVGQPFQQYRLNGLSNGDILQPGNLIADDIRIKLSACTSKVFIENDILHSNVFQMLVSSDAVLVGDALVQNDSVYGGNSTYFVASSRPLKPVLVSRCEYLCQVYRPASARATAVDRYAAPNDATRLPYMCVSGVVTIGVAGQTASFIPCGVHYIGQIKTQKTPHLPMDTLTAWWYLYLPPLPGLTRLHENDVIQIAIDPNEPDARFRVHSPYIVPVGLAGSFLLCERLNG